MFKNRKGFTLLELLVVVLIIGILAAIALPQYQMAVGKAKFATLKDNARTIKNSLDGYYLMHDAYTYNLNDLDVKVTNECHIHSNNLIYCSQNIFGSKMNFALGFGYRHGQKQRCFIETNVTNQLANKLCQLETGRTTPNEDYSSYKAYHYK